MKAEKRRNRFLVLTREWKFPECARLMSLTFTQLQRAMDVQDHGVAPFSAVRDHAKLCEPGGWDQIRAIRLLVENALETGKYETVFPQKEIEKIGLNEARKRLLAVAEELARLIDSLNVGRRVNKQVADIHAVSAARLEI